MFLSTYCSDKVKARASIINGNKYINIQFLNEFIKDNLSNTLSIPYIIDKHTLKFTFKLEPNTIRLTNISVITSNAFKKSLVNIQDINACIIKRYIEYVAYPPKIVIDAMLNIRSNNDGLIQCLHIIDGSKVLINNICEIVTEHYDIDQSLLHRLI